MIRMSTEILVYSIFAASFSLFSFLKAISSPASFTKALITAMPEKLSWEKSDSCEKHSCRQSHFFVISLPTMEAQAKSRAMGIRDRAVSR